MGMVEDVSGPKITNFGKNMLEFRFLTKYGAQLLCDDEVKNAFYY